MILIKYIEENRIYRRCRLFIFLILAFFLLQSCKSLDMTVMQEFKADIGVDDEEQVVSISIHNILFNDSHVPTLLQFPKLKRLYLMNTSVTDVGMKSIGKLKNLQLLNLSNGKFSYKGITYIERLPHLEELILEGNTMIRNSAIITLSRMPSLKYLNVRNTSVSLDALLLLQKKLPDCLVEF
ncbi:hypothetical protein JYT61_01310 [bacterium AH-315-E10]|nr:hypothetical protein [bacterium AH-315-E10]